MSVMSLQRKRAACDKCRAKKLKCTGELPICSRCERASIPCIYALQKPMGRPRKRARTSDDILSLPVDQALADSAPPSSDSSRSHLDSESVWTADDLADYSDFTNSFVNLEPTLSDASSLSRPSWNAPSELTSQDVTTSFQQPCACLSAMYLTLDNLRGMENFSFPFSLHLLRNATATGWDVVACEYCPKTFLTAMQNVQLLGLLLVNIAERYVKVLQAIDAERQRLVLANETKTFRVGDMAPANSHMHTGQIDCPGSFMIELQPQEWISMAKKGVKAEIHGRDSDETSRALSRLIRYLEERQHAWHTLSRKDAPDSCKGRNPTDKPLCLALASEAKRVLASMDLD